MKKMFLVPVVLVLVLASLAIAGERVVYTVKSGDTLGELMYTWRIQGIEINKLYAWNPSLGTQLKIGQEIVYYLPDRQDVQKITEKDVRKIVAQVIARMEAAKISVPEPAAQPLYQPQVSIGKVALILGAIALFIFLLNILIDRRSRGKKVITQETFAVFETPSVRAEKKSTKAEPVFTTEWIEVDGYSVFIEYAASEGRWYSPFINASGGRVYEPTQTKIIGSVRRCLNNSKFSEQVKSLKDTGLIRLIQ